MGIRYRTLDLPPQGTGAFLPLAATNPVASSYGLVEVIGSPGTMPIKVTPPERTGWPSRSIDPKTMESNCAPDVILPAIYYTTAKNMGPQADAGIGMHARRLVPLPVPALDALRVAYEGMKRQRIAGRKAMSWPRAFQRFNGQSG